MAQQSALRIKRNSPIIPRTWRYLRRKWHVTLAPFPSAVIKFYTHDKTLQLKLETFWEFWKYVCNDAGTWDLLITSIFCVISSASISSTIYCHKKRNHFSSFVCPPVNRASCFRCAWLRAFKAVTLFHYFEHLRISIFDDLNIPQTPKSSANSATSAHPRELRDNVVDANNKFFYTQQQSQAVQYRCMSVSIGIEVTGITKEQHGKKNDGAWAFAGKLEQWREGRRERWRRVKGKELRNATITRDLCSLARPKKLANAARNFFLPLPSAVLPRVAAAVMQLQSGVSLGERKLRELHRPRGLLCVEVYPRRCIGASAKTSVLSPCCVSCCRRKTKEIAETAK